MNYYEDFAGQYLSRSDGNAMRGHYSNRDKSIDDIATYPFRFSGFKYSGTTVASVSPSEVAQGDQVTIRNFTLENIGSSSLNNVKLKLYLSLNDNITTSDHLLGTVSFSSLSTWWDDDGTGRSFTVPSTIPGGTYYVGAIVTYNNGSEDSVGYNNKWVLDESRRVTVTGADDQYEENDDLASATPITEQTWYNAIQADDDWYMIYVDAGFENVVVDLRFRHSEGDIDLRLYDSAGNSLDRSTSTTDNESIDYTVPVGDTYYYLRVYFDDAGNNYTLWWDDIASAPIYRTLTVSKSGNGRVTSNPFGIDCGTDCSEDFTDGSQIILTAVPDSEWGFSGWSGACSGSVATCTLTMDTPKTVTANFITLAVPGDSFEPDDASNQATLLQPNGPQNHTIAPVGDEDWMRFQLTRESRTVLETSGPDGDTRMWLYDSGLSEVEFNDDAGERLFSRIDRLCGTDALPTGTYYVKVDDFGDNDLIDPYSISLTVSACTTIGDAYEPDDNSGQAGLLQPGNAQTHSIGPVGDKDWMRFELTAESEVVLTTSGTDGDDTRMWLFDGGLTEVEFNDDDGSGLFSRIDRLCGSDALTMGTYYVLVDEFADNDEIDAYNIALQVSACGNVIRLCEHGPVSISGVNYTHDSWEIESETTLSAGGAVTVGSGANVTYRAGTRVTLGEGFHAQAGSVFRARIRQVNCAQVTIGGQTAQTK